MLVPERDEHVDFVLRNWDEVTALADLPLPPDPETVLRLRRKDQLPLAAAEAGVPCSGDVLPRERGVGSRGGARAALSAEAGGGPGVRAPLRRQGCGRERRRRGRGRLAASARRGLRDDPPGAHPGLARARLLAVRLRRARRGAAGNRRRTQGTPGTAPLRHERRVRGPLRARRARARAPAARLGGLHGLRARRVRPRSARRDLQGARGEHACSGVGRRRDDGGVRRRAASPTTTCAASPPRRGRRSRGTSPGSTWRRTSGSPRRWRGAASSRSATSSAHHVRTGKVRAVFAPDDPLPALASVGYLRSRL